MNGPLTEEGILGYDFLRGLPCGVRIIRIWKRSLSVRNMKRGSAGNVASASISTIAVNAPTRNFTVSSGRSASSGRCLGTDERNKFVDEGEMEYEDGLGNGPMVISPPTRPFRGGLVRDTEGAETG
jgi:hypothetical protein